MTGSVDEVDLDRYARAGMDGCIEKGCVVSRAMHEALAMYKEHRNAFIFINLRNVQILRPRQSQSLEWKAVDSPSGSEAATNHDELQANGGNAQSSPTSIMLQDEKLDALQNESHSTSVRCGVRLPASTRI